MEKLRKNYAAMCIVSFWLLKAIHEPFFENCKQKTETVRNLVDSQITIDDKILPTIQAVINEYAINFQSNSTDV